LPSLIDGDRKPARNYRFHRFVDHMARKPVLKAGTLEVIS
jgi:hypothetical protein